MARRVGRFLLRAVCSSRSSFEFVGGLGLLLVNRGRVRHQEGVATASAANAARTGVALGATGYARFLGTKLGEAGSVSAAAGTVPSGGTPPDVVRTQQQMRALQWAIPVTTGGIIALWALQGEQQGGDETRPRHGARGGQASAAQGRPRRPPGHLPGA